MAEKLKRGPKPKNGVPMTGAERQRASRKIQREFKAAQALAEIVISAPPVPKRADVEAESGTRHVPSRPFVKPKIEKAVPRAPEVTAPAAPTVTAPPKPTRRQRSDSTAAMVKAMVNASRDYPPVPAHMVLSDDALPYWNAIMTSRALDDWAGTDLIAAATLAQCQADYAWENALLREEGRVVVDYLGKESANPRVGITATLATRMMALMRTLRIGGVAAGKAEPLAASRKLEAQSRKLRTEMEDEDGLLA